ncbi:hypothetical protein HPB49_019430 [Dermacentor silvarum]|uniref:Uncharacterized protein n=1 Tax=Dermacentor silvarum TaxID=543639 RepID=A0ACB8C578_DERSI|nr:hypothetical protein HPB49_019430 [Dermacentor silvarum]
MALYSVNIGNKARPPSCHWRTTQTPPEETRVGLQHRLGTNLAMGCWEDMMRAVREMGDPDELANSESLVLLKLEKPLPSDRAIPQQLTANASRSVLTTDQEGLAGCRSFLNKQCYSTVLFAGLPSLRSTKSFLAAAKDIVGKAQELIIVHNRQAQPLPVSHAKLWPGAHSDDNGRSTMA